MSPAVFTNGIGLLKGPQNCLFEGNVPELTFLIHQLQKQVHQLVCPTTGVY
jgi:hypothetical protein